LAPGNCPEKTFNPYPRRNAGFQMEAIILIGIQAVGKSTFCKEKFYDTHVRLNLDMLKTRHREMLLLHACIAAKQSFVVDNTNTLKNDRSRYISLAKPAGFDIIGYYFQSNLKEALERNYHRAGKGNIPEIGVISKYRKLEIPHYSEGFDQLHYVSIDPATSKFIIKEWIDEI
jgi:predicted kinase